MTGVDPGYARGNVLSPLGILLTTVTILESGHIGKLHPDPSLRAFEWEFIVQGIPIGARRFVRRVLVHQLAADGEVEDGLAEGFDLVVAGGEWGEVVECEGWRGSEMSPGRVRAC